MAPEITANFEPRVEPPGETSVTIYGTNLSFQQNSVKVHFGTYILATALKSYNRGDDVVKGTQ